jgi:poly(A) polymerase
MSLAELKKTVSEPYFQDLFELQRAIQRAERKSTTALANLRKRIKALKDVELKPKPLLNGHEMIQLGAVPGPALGQLAEEMYVAQLEGILQTAQQARQWVQKWLMKHKMIEK